VLETATLCDARVRDAIRAGGIELRAFGDLSDEVLKPA
jgi:hypothetical protein